MSEECIPDSEKLWRRIHADHLLDGDRVSSAAFSGDQMSVDIASIQRNMSITLSDGVGVAEFECAAARKLDQQVVADPLKSNPAHALVKGHKTKGVQRRLRNAARFQSRELILQEIDEAT